MIDRRFVAVLLVAVVAVFALRSVMSNTPAPPAESPVSIDPRLADRLTPTAAAARTVSTDDVDDVITTSTTVTTAEASSTTPVDLVELVQARRPTIEVIETPDHEDDGERDPTGERGSATIEQTAADLVVAGWTWRFDDDDTRHLEALALVADTAVVDALAPEPAEGQRRIDAGEVSWVIVRGINVDGPQATVRFDQHVVTSTSSETVTARKVLVTVDAGAVVVVEVTL